MNKSRFVWFIGSLCLIILAVFIISMGGTAVASNQSAQSSNAPSFLTGPNRGEPLDIALEYIGRNRESLGLTQADVSDFIVTDQYTSRHNGTTHIYLRQVYQDIEVFGANININIAQDGAVINMGNHFVPDLAGAINTAEPSLTPVDAVQAAAQALNLTLTEPLVEQEKFDDAAQTTRLSDGGISLKAIPARLVYQPLERQGVRLAWEVEIYELDAQNWWNIRIDALTGAALGRFNYVIHDNFGAPDGMAHSATTGAAAPPEAPQNSMLLPDQYNVYALPLESPSHGGRTLEVDPANTTASPFGWHDTNGAPGAESTHTVGNNVDAYEDTNNSNSPTGGNDARANGGASLNFDFPIDLGQQPSTYQDAAITNLFYWNNIIHDVMYHYGFDEAGGNFQENNYGNGGAGSDSVNAEAQDGGGVNNANFATPADGSNPRMQMYLWNLTSPMRDGDLDNGIIVHEYAHGISNRLTGGPGNVFCLGNTEQPGEGWSDWYALMLTIEAGDAGTDRRGIGTYALGEPTTGDGIRDYPYSTDMAIDPRTYDEIKTAAVPHGVGSTWAAITWEVTWALIDTYGFDPDIYNGSGGNNIALQLITDGLKLQPCSPGFVDARDAILLADQNNNGGANQCLLWEAFAKRGLGFSADQGSSGSRGDGTEAFDLPPICLQNLKITKTASPDPAPAGGILTYNLLVANDTPGTLTGVVVTDIIQANQTYVNGSATCGGSESGGVVTFPIGTMSSGASINCSFQVTVSGGIGSTQFFFDDFEGGLGNWTTSGLWNLEGEGDTCGSQQAPFPSPTNAAYYGNDATCNYDTGAANTGSLTMNSDIALPVGSSPSLNFYYFLETEQLAPYDEAIVEISTNGGGTWTQLLQVTDSGWQEVATDLSAYAGSNVRFRFTFDTVDSAFNNFFGWLVDDVLISEEATVFNEACVTANEGDNDCDSVTTLVESGVPPTPTNTPVPPTPTNTPVPPTPTNTPVPPTPTNTPVPPTPTSTPSATSLHVADLDGSSINNGSTWTAVVTILVVDNNGAPVSGATVSGNWSNGATGSAVCVTDSSGTCDVSVSDILKKTKDVTFTVSNISHATLTYNPAANTDPDGDSDGTTIVVAR